MKKNRRLAWILFSVCLVMLVAAVFPHHHHNDMTLCMQYDLQQCDAGCCAHTQHSHSHSGGQDCGSGCITSFFCDAPHPVQTIQPVYFSLIDLFSITDACRLLLFERQMAEYPVCYVESLHASDYHRVYGLRAPPYA